jgi:hypothetical protein
MATTQTTDSAGTVIDLDAPLLPTPAAAPAGPSPLDSVMFFFQTIFTGTADETPAQKAAVLAIINKSFSSGYTFDGKPMAPAALFAWRESFWKRFSQMTFRVHNALSADVDAGTASPTTAVAIMWQADALELGTGKPFRLRGANFLGMQNGLAASNVQLGDAGKGWQPVSGS